MTKAKTTQANMKLRNRWPCQKLLISLDCAGGGGGGSSMLMVSSECSATSTLSLKSATFFAVEPHISHILNTIVIDSKYENE